MRFTKEIISNAKKELSFKFGMHVDYIAPGNDADHSDVYYENLRSCSLFELEPSLNVLVKQITVENEQIKISEVIPIGMDVMTAILISYELMNLKNKEVENLVSKFKQESGLC
jgi:hypothetical protein